MLDIPYYWKVIYYILYVLPQENELKHLFDVLVIGTISKPASNVNILHVHNLIHTQIKCNVNTNAEAKLCYLPGRRHVCCNEEKEEDCGRGGETV